MSAPDTIAPDSIAGDLIVGAADLAHFMIGMTDGATVAATRP